MSLRLADYSRTLTGMEAYCIRAFAEALEIIPFTLAENAGLNPIATVTDLRNRHAQGEKTAGINVRKVCSCCMMMMQGMMIKKCSACPWGKLQLTVGPLARSLFLLVRISFFCVPFLPYCEWPKAIVF